MQTQKPELTQSNSSASSLHKTLWMEEKCSCLNLGGFILHRGNKGKKHELKPAAAASGFQENLTLWQCLLPPPPIPHGAGSPPSVCLMSLQRNILLRYRHIHHVGSKAEPENDESITLSWVRFGVCLIKPWCFGGGAHTACVEHQGVLFSVSARL